MKKNFNRHKRATQCQKLRDWLITHGDVSTFEGRERLGIPHVAGRIQDLRKKHGLMIVTRMVWEKSAHSDHAHLVGRYFLVEAGKAA